MPDLTVRFPETLLLVLPVLLLWWLLLRRGPGAAWRLAVLLGLVLAAADPELAWRRGGSDVVLILDQSDSMLAGELAATASGAAPPAAGVDPDRMALLERQDEITAIVAGQRRTGDRLAVVVVGDGARVAQPPLALGGLRLADTKVPGTATDLHAGLEIAAGLIARGRSGRVLLVSDGEHTGRDPRAVAAALALRGLPVDVLPTVKVHAPDAAILDLEIPGEMRLGESFVGALRCLGDVAETRGYRIHRDGVLVAEGKLALQPGRPVAASFADRPPRPGLSRYVATLDAGHDRAVLNNTARAALRVAGGERVLLVGGDGRPGNLARAAQAAGQEVVCRPEGPLGLDDLLAARVLLLEQVPADAIGGAGLRNIARWVEHLGGGLVMTGGRRGFGSGGYHQSAVETVLPVTLEIRDEHRKTTAAIAVCLDRSGSMGMPVGRGLVKMDLANRGTAAVIDLLGPHDQIAVFAVDSAAHTVVPLCPVTDPAALRAPVLRIESQGGGIFIYEALVAGGRALAGSNRGTRHLVLFSDAADSEEPGAYRELLAEYRKAGITVSVIGLGSERDCDAELLRDVAQRGGGRLAFADDAVELPRVFAQETMLVARSSWVDGPVVLQRRPELASVLSLGPSMSGPWPEVPGYNLTYPRERAEVLAWAPGDPAAPAIAAWHIGAGRSVALALDLDGPHSGALPDWPGYVPLVSGLLRWAGGGDEGEVGALFAERQGRSVNLRLELDPARREDWPESLPRLVLLRDGAGTEPEVLPLLAVDDGVFVAHAELTDEVVVLPSALLQWRGREVALLGPALQLPYSPEAEPRFGHRPGGGLLAELAALTRGQVRADLDDLFANPPSPGENAPLGSLLAALALGLLVAEILIRRLHLGRRRGRRAAGASAAPAAVAIATTPINPSAPIVSPAASPAGAPPPDRGLHEALRRLRDRGGR